MIRNAVRLCSRHTVSKEPLARFTGVGSIRGALFGSRQNPPSPSQTSIAASSPPPSTSEASNEPETSLPATYLPSSSRIVEDRRRLRGRTAHRKKTQSLPFSSSPSPPAASRSAPSQPASLEMGADADADARRALLRESVADAAGALYSVLLTDERASAELFPSKGLEALEGKLGYSFPSEHSWLLRAALVHKSYRAESGKYAASDLLSWYGDATLYSMLTEEMIAAYPGAGISDLTAARVCRISRESLCSLAKSVGIDELVAVGKSFGGLGGVGGSGGGALSTGMLGEAFEAVLGAVSASGGEEAARRAYLKVSPLPPKLRDLMAEAMRSGGGGGCGGSKKG